MMRRLIMFGSPGAAVSGCSEEDSSAYYEDPVYCTASVARAASLKAITPILEGIAEPATREASCEELDDILRERTWSEQIATHKPEDCQWGYNDDVNPYEIILRIIEPRGDTLAKLCDWERKDAERTAQRLHDRGAAILRSLPDAEREQIQREWDSYAQD